MIFSLIGSKFFKRVHFPLNSDESKVHVQIYWLEDLLLYYSLGQDFKVSPVILLRHNTLCYKNDLSLTSLRHIFKLTDNPLSGFRQKSNTSKTVTCHLFLKYESTPLSSTAQTGLDPTSRFW